MLDRHLFDAIEQCMELVHDNGNDRHVISFNRLPAEILALIDAVIGKSIRANDETISDEIRRCYGDISGVWSRRSSAIGPRLILGREDPPLTLTFGGQQESFVYSSDPVWDISEITLAIPQSIQNSLRAEISRRRHDSNWTEATPYIDFWVRISDEALKAFLKGVPRHCYYLPAARSGMLQGHKLMASAVVQRAPFGGRHPIEVPTLSALAADFMAHMLTLERSRGQHSSSGIGDAVAFLEHEVVHGSVNIENADEVTYPEIAYSPSFGQPVMGSFPLQKTSSMVSELAPVILFLKHLVRPGDLFILEEPESHLHPASQRQMARGIARLVNAGVKVIITTHSDYFVGQLNNCIKVSRASKAKRRKEKFDADDCLKSEDVGAYHFKFDEELGGSVVKELEIYPGYGIDVEDFGEVSLDLYEETVSLQNIRPK